MLIIASQITLVLFLISEFDFFSDFFGGKWLLLLQWSSMFVSIFFFFFPINLTPSVFHEFMKKYCTFLVLRTAMLLFF